MAAAADASQQAREARAEALGDPGRSELLAALEASALSLQRDHCCQVGVVVLEARGCVRAYGVTEGPGGATVAELEPVLQRYRELSGSFDGADPGCARCSAWRQERSNTDAEFRKRNSMTDLLSVAIGAPEPPLATPERAQVAAATEAEAEAALADAAAAAAVGWGSGLSRQARGLCRLVEPWLGGLAADRGAKGCASACAAFLSLLERASNPGDVPAAEGDEGLWPGAGRGLAAVSQYRSANRRRLLDLARELGQAIQSATAAAVDAPPDYARVLRRHYREAATVYDWTDHDLPDMIIADLPARRVLADGPL